MCEQVNNKLNDPLDQGIIQKVEGPTGVLVPKPNNDIRICVDMRKANTAVLITAVTQ